MGLVLGLVALSVTGLTIWRASRQQERGGAWRSRVAAEMPRLGHRNWILVVDSAYPLQTSPGVETIETNESQQEVVKAVLATINASIHVRPLISMDAELAEVPDADAPGVSAYRAEMGSLLHGLTVSYLLHDQVISNVEETAKSFHVLVLKTTMTIPYTSVFIRLDCKYWSAEAEERLRARMASGAAGH